VERLISWVSGLTSPRAPAMPPRGRGGASASPANTSRYGKMDPKGWPTEQLPAFLTAMGVDPAPFQADLVTPQILVELSEEDLASLGVSVPSAQRLAAELKHVKDGIQIELDCGEPVANCAATLLVNRLDDEDSDVRAHACTSLSSLLQKGDARGLRTVSGKADDPSPKVRKACMMGLKALAPKPEKAILAILSNGISDSDAGVRAACLEAVTAIVTPAETDLKLANRILHRLEDSDPAVRRAAVGALVVLKKSDPDVLWGLQHKMDHGSALTRRAVLHALEHVLERDDACAVAYVMDGLCDEDATVREAAVKVIKAGKVVTTEAGRALTLLLNLTQHALPATRQAALCALPTLCPRGSRKLVMPLLVMRLQDSDWAVRREAAICVGILGDRLDDRVVQVLQGLVDDEEAYVQKAAEEALTKLREK